MQDSFLLSCIREPDCL